MRDSMSRRIVVRHGREEGRSRAEGAHGRGRESHIFTHGETSHEYTFNFSTWSPFPFHGFVVALITGDDV